MQWLVNTAYLALNRVLRVSKSFKDQNTEVVN